MTESRDDWNNYRMFIVTSLERLETKLDEAKAESELARFEHSKRLDAIERLIAEGRGAWKVAAVLAGFAGALVMKLISKVIVF